MANIFLARMWGNALLGLPLVNKQCLWDGPVSTGRMNQWSAVPWDWAPGASTDKDGGRVPLASGFLVLWPPLLIHMFGSSPIPHPQNVTVFGDEGDQDEVMAMGVSPV